MIRVMIDGVSRTDDKSNADQPPPGSDLLSLEEVAEASGVAPRTIRYYQTKKLLPRTLKDPSDGRVARYNSDHVERLRLIGELHDRGLKLPAIRELFDSADPQARISEWLGLSDTLRGRWSDASPQLLTQAELDDLLGGAPAGTLGQFEETRLVVRQGDSWLVPNRALLELAAELVANDIAADLVIEAGEILHRRLSKASSELIDLFVRALEDGYGDGADAGALVHSVRLIAGDAARMIFGQELEREIEDLLTDTKRLGRATSGKNRKG